jgi:acyl-CoA thioesterase FadM
LGDGPLSGRRGAGAQVPGAGAAGLPAAEVTGELLDRRAAVAELGAELRALADLVTRTEAATGMLRDSARRLREVAPALRERIRGIGEPASADDLMGGVRMFNPVIGAGNPIAPPMRIEIGADGAEGWCTLGHVYEGPPMYGHGGVSAMLIDQLLGHAAAASGHPGVTTDLSVRYRRPVPLDVPLQIWGRVTGTQGRRVSAVDGITTVAKPGVPPVEAEARFARLRLDQARSLFSSLASPDAATPDVAHD